MFRPEERQIVFIVVNSERYMQSMACRRTDKQKSCCLTLKFLQDRIYLFKSLGILCRERVMKRIHTDERKYFCSTRIGEGMSLSSLAKIKACQNFRTDKREIGR